MIAPMDRPDVVAPPWDDRTGRPYLLIRPLVLNLFVTLNLKEAGTCITGFSLVWGLGWCFSC